MKWTIHHRQTTASTNQDAHAGKPGDVYTADYQTAGRGRLDHKWISPPGTNLLMSVVLSVEGVSQEVVPTFSLAVGLAVCRAIAPFAGTLRGLSPQIKWPNDVLLSGKKVAGILCERHGDNVIAGIGVNVKDQKFSDEIEGKAVSLGCDSRDAVRDAVLKEIDIVYEKWRRFGFLAIYDEVSAVDCLKGRQLGVYQTDKDETPVMGLCEGIAKDGSLVVDGRPIYAGEAHIDQGKHFL